MVSSLYEEAGGSLGALSASELPRDRCLLCIADLKLMPIFVKIFTTSYKEHTSYQIVCQHSCLCSLESFKELMEDPTVSNQVNSVAWTKSLPNHAKGYLKCETRYVFTSFKIQNPM